LRDRRMQALALGRAAVGYGDIAWRQGKMLEGFASVDVADHHLEKLQGPEVHRDMEAMVGAGGAWSLNTAGINDHKAVSRRPYVFLEPRQHPPEHRWHPRTTRAPALRHRLVRDGLVQRRQGPRYLTQGFIQATIEEDHPQELLGRFDLLGPHKGFELPRHLRCLGWQVLQKFLKERIWICQGQRHGRLLLWTGGAHVSSMPYALMAYYLQLILAQMGVWVGQGVGHPGRASVACGRPGTGPLCPRRHALPPTEPL